MQVRDSHTHTLIAHQITYAQWIFYMIIIELKFTIFICANIHYIEYIQHYCYCYCYIHMLMFDAHISHYFHLYSFISQWSLCAFERMHTFSILYLFFFSKCVHPLLYIVCSLEIHLWILNKSRCSHFQQWQKREREKKGAGGKVNDTYFSPQTKRNKIIIQNLRFQSENHSMQKKNSLVVVIVSLKILLPDIF